MNTTKSVSIHVAPGLDNRFYVHIWLHHWASNRPTSHRRSWGPPSPIAGGSLNAALEAAAWHLLGLAEEMRAGGAPKGPSGPPGGRQGDV